MSDETQTDTEPAELTAADFEPVEGQDETAASESASDEQETESQAAGEGEGEQGDAPKAQEEADPYAEPPEFWAAEHKALWSKDLPPEFRAAVHEHVKQASRSISEKMMEAANERKKAEEQVQRFAQERDQLANWWQDMAPKLAQAFRNKYDGVDEVKFAEEDPAGYAKWQAERNRDVAMLQQAHERHQAEISSAQERAKRAFEATKRSEHEKLVSKLPDHFGEGKAQATYDRLGKYLAGYGFDQKRIEATYEASVIEIAHKAMLYDEAQAKLKEQPKTTPATATQTSKRIVPGGRQAQPNQSEKLRQAEQRLRTGQTLSDADVERLFG